MTAPVFNPAALILREFHPVVRLWLLRELVAATLFPVFRRLRSAQRAHDVVKIDHYELLFLRIVGATDCYPCRVEWSEKAGPLAVYIPTQWDIDNQDDDFGFGEEAFA